MDLHEMLFKADREGETFIPEPIKPATIYQHRYLPGLTCVKLAETAKGWKVQETNTNRRGKPKVRQQFYNAADFNQATGIWKPSMQL